MKFFSRNLARISSCVAPKLKSRFYRLCSTSLRTRYSDFMNFCGIEVFAFCSTSYSFFSFFFDYFYTTCPGSLINSLLNKNKFLIYFSKMNARSSIGIVLSRWMACILASRRLSTASVYWIFSSNAVVS